MSEVGQGFVNGLPGCADELCDLLLGEVMGHPHGATLLRAEALGQL